MILSPLELMRRGEEVENLLLQCQQALEAEDMEKARTVRDKMKALLHRLENDLP